MATMKLDGQSWEFDVSRLTNVEAMEVEKVTGMSFAKWLAAVDDGSMLAMTALVYIVRKRTEPTLRFGDVSFALGDLEIETPAEDPTPAAVETPAAS